jgi:hypothetical protein
MEGDDGAGVGRGAYLLHVIERLALGILLAESLALAVNLCGEMVAESIHAADAHTVQTTGYLIAPFVELTAGVQYCEHHLQGRAMLFLVHTYRDTAAIVGHTDGIPLQDGDLHIGAEARQGLVYRVVYYLIYKMMESACGDVTDIHRRTLAYSFQAFEDLNTSGRIILIFLVFQYFVFFFHIFNYILAKIRKNPGKTLLSGALKTQNSVKN